MLTQVSALSPPTCLSPPTSTLAHPWAASLRGASRSYRSGNASVVALDDVSLDVRRGAFLAIVGASGSGKSTLLNVLGTLDGLDAGTYLLDGVDTRTLSDEALSRLRNRKIGFVFQAFHLLPRYTALDNVALPLAYAGVARRERYLRAEHALAQVGLGERIQHRPQELSGGQQQRVAIARALVTGPALILADEPTGALDSSSAAEVLRLFEKLHADRLTLVLVTHDREVAARAEERVLMRDGRIVEHTAAPERAQT